MKVAFWESLRKESKEISSMAAISITLALNYYKRVVLLDNGQENDSFERIFRGIQRFYYVKDDLNYLYHRNGMDYILNDIHKTNDPEPLLRHSAVEVIKEYLYYVPQSKVINHLAYEYALNEELIPIIRRYERLSDYTMIRARNGNNLSTKQVLDIADIVMVELSQNYDLLDEFFDNYSSIRHKAIFIFNQYKTKSISIYHIMNKYRIKKDQVIVISEHQPMKAACLGGNLLNYIKTNNDCNKGSENYRCVRELKRAAKIIVREEREKWSEAII